jgi:hypothetical protein
MLALMLAAANPLKTGLAVHEWLGIAVAVPALLHLALNWDWVTSSTRTLFSKMAWDRRVNLVIDTALFMSAVTVAVSGLAISRIAIPAMGALSTPLWHALHGVSAIGAIAMSVAHTVMHTKWIANASIRIVPEEQR